MPKDKSGNSQNSNPKIEFKPKFIERYSGLTDFELFKEYSLRFLRRSIRVNTLKMPVKEIKKRLSKEWTLTQVPWCNEGFWIEHKGEEKRRDIGNLREHTLGYIYVQEAASMIPPIVLDPKPGEINLDICASPGSKSSQIAQYMQNKGILVCNDYTGIRLAPLGINLQRVGAYNTITTIMHGQGFPKTNQLFDRILVDAPCSGTGTIRKSLKTLRIWNPKMVSRLAHTQKSILEAAFNRLKTGGTLVYSTCSCEPEENEGVVSRLIESCGDSEVCEIDIKINRSETIKEFGGIKFNPETRKCLRIWPQDNDTEGFFVARIMKK